MLIVIVDDDNFNLRVFEKIVGSSGDHDVRCFNVSAEALEWCSSNDPDLIITDYNMPAPDGLGFIESLGKQRALSRTPVMMITSESDKKLRYRALELGASDFLNKPVDEVEMVARVRNLLEVRQNRTRLERYAHDLDIAVANATDKLREREQDTIHCLTRAAEFRDNETGMHIVRMGHYSAVLGRAAGFSPAEAELMLLAAPMHDVGKVATPDYILLKNGPLTPSEFEIMKQHTVAGYEILRGVDSDMLRLAATIALTHHERFDGSGYPNGVKGTEIPIAGRIVAICDVFDALLSNRPYKEAWPLDRTLDALSKGRGSHFDPELVLTFFGVMKEILELRREYSD